MIDFKTLSAADRELLASSQFGNLRADQIPANWRQRIERDLAARGAIIASEEEDPIGGPEGSNDDETR